MNATIWIRNLLEAFVTGIGKIFGLALPTRTPPRARRTARRAKSAHRESRGKPDPGDRAQERLHRRMMSGRH